MTVSRFNIRVYILLLNEHKTHVLLSDEIINGKFYTKFPGGGLEYGEGILDCLHREAIEELGQDIEVLRQFYTTESYQVSMFKPEDQIICIYYECRLPRNAEGQRTPTFRITDKKFDFEKMCEREESFRWQSIKSLKKEDVSLPLDQQVVSLLIDRGPDPI